MQALLSEITYQIGKRGWSGMMQRMTEKHKLTGTKDSKENAVTGTAHGVAIKIVDGKHNDRNYRRVFTADGKTLLFKG